MEFTVLKKEDAQLFVDFFDQLIRETDYLLPTVEESHKTKEKQEASIERFNDFKHVFIAKDNNQIVGFIGITRMGLKKVKHIADFAIGVLSDYKRQHIATRLLTIAEDWLRERGVNRLEMTVIAENDGAVSFYKKNGFQQEGIRRRSIFMRDHYYDELYMAKFL